jgi:general secretion pathway protein H
VLPSGAPSRRGVVLLDLVLAIAIAALLLLVILPVLPIGTSPSRQAAYAAQVAAVLKADRTAAARGGSPVATRIEVPERRISSGSSRRAIVLPRDLTLDVLASDLCRSAQGTYTIVFAVDGRSCGAVIHILKGDRDWGVRINWLTGHVDVVRPDRG